VWHKILFVVIATSFLMSCENNPAASKFKKIEEDCLLYYLWGENIHENRIYSLTEGDRFFTSGDLYFLRINENRSKLAYLKEPESKENEQTEIFVADLNGKGEKKVYSGGIPYDVEWIGNSELALSVKEEEKFFILFTGIDQKEIREKIPVTDQMKLCLLPDKRHLTAYNETDILILDIESGEIKFNYQAEEVAYYQKPFYAESAGTFYLYDYYLKVNLNDYSCEKFSLEEEERLIFWNDQYKILYNYEDNKELRLLEGDQQISSAQLFAYHPETGFYITENREFYCIAEIGDDESCILKVDFNDGSITKLTNHGEDNIIVDFRYYSF
jgi:hypothetical protein